MKQNCLITLVFAYSCLSYMHVSRIFWDNGQWVINCDLPMMINTLKISSIPFILYDGSKSPDKLVKDQAKLLIKSKPTFLEYFSYVLFVPTAIIGPFYEFRTHYDYLYQTGDFANPNKPSRWPEVINKTARALLYIVIYTICQTYFSYEAFFELREFRLKEFISVALAYTIIFRYLIGWKFTEAHFAICGISYNKEKEDYSGIMIVNDYEMIVRPNPETVFSVSTIYLIVSSIGILQFTTF